MKNLKKILCLMCALVLVLSGSVLLSACNKKDNEKTAVELLNQTCKDYESSLYHPTMALSNLISVLDAYGDYGDVGEYSFFNPSMLYKIQQFEKDGEYLEQDEYSVFMITKTNDGKYKITTIEAYEGMLYTNEGYLELKITENNEMQMISTQTEIVDEGTEDEIEQKSISTSTFAMDAKSEYFKIETSFVATENGVVCYAQNETVEYRIVSNTLYAQRFEHTSYYEDSELDFEISRLYTLKANYNMTMDLITEEVTTEMTRFIACAEDDVTSWESIKDSIPENFATQNIDVDWSL